MSIHNCSTLIGGFKIKSNKVYIKDLRELLQITPKRNVFWDIEISLRKKTTLDNSNITIKYFLCLTP